MNMKVDIEKEINKMARAMCSREKQCDECGTDLQSCSMRVAAIRAHKAGYCHLRSVIAYCKECKFYVPYSDREDFDGYCQARGCDTDQFDFCNYAEKKVDESKYYFYCPHCRKEEEVSALPEGTFSSTECPIKYYKCSNCYSLDAGFLPLSKYEKRIIRQIIQGYEGIRGFDKEKDMIWTKLLEAVEAIKPFYDVDKIKPYGVFIWTKGEIDTLSKNVFDIYADEIQKFDTTHIIPKEVMPIIENIQKYLERIY